MSAENEHGEGDLATVKDDQSATSEGDLTTGEGDLRVTWVTLRDAEHATGVSVSTLRKWRKRGDLESRMEPGPTGERIVVPLESVRRLAVERNAGTPPTPATTAPPPTPGEGTPPTPEAEPEPPRWAIELLAKADARTEALMERYREAEQERADAQRDARVAEYKLEHAETEVARLEAELERLQGGERNPTPDIPTEPATGDADEVGRLRALVSRLRRK